MILKKIKRILAFSLLLAMLLSILPPTALAAGDGTLESGQYVIAAKVGDVYYAMSNTFASKINGIVITVTDGKVSPKDAEGYTINLTAVADGYTIDDGNGNYVKYNSSTNLAKTTTAYTWTISEGTNGAYRVAAQTSGRGLVFRAKTYNQFGGYATSNCSAGSAEYFDIEFLPIDDGSGSEEPTCKHVNKTTNTVDATCTTAGSVTVICDDCSETLDTTVIPALGHSYSDGVCETCGKEEPSFAKADKIAVGDIVFLVCEADAIELNGFTTSGTIYGSGESYTDIIQGLYPLEVVAGTADGTVAFRNEDNYLNWKSGNSLSTSTEVSANSSWTVTFDDKGNAVITNAKDTTRVIYWNSTNPRFACYTNSNQKVIQLYKFVEGEAPTEPCEHQWDDGVVTIDPTCTEDGVKTFTCTLCGDVKKNDVEPALGHSWITATCDAPSHCENCDATGGAYIAVENVADLADDDRILIAVKVNEDYYTIDSLLKSGKFSPFGTWGSGTHLDNTDNALVWTLVETEGGFALYRGGKYLAYNSSTNFKLSDDPYAWNISKNDLGFQIAATTADRSVMYSLDTEKFGAYANSNLNSSSYNSNLKIYKYVDGATVPHWDDEFDNQCDGCHMYFEPAALIYRSISLNGNIAVNFYMSLSGEVVFDESAYMLFTQEGKEPVKVYIADTRVRTMKGGKIDLYCFSYEVAAKEMTDTITAQFCYGEGNYTQVYDYSVKTYADNQREKLADNEALVNLLDAMLHYGAASQIQFNYHTERLADTDLKKADYSSVTIKDYSLDLPQGTKLVTLAGASLLLKSETTLRYFFRVDPSVAESLTVTYAGTPLQIVIRNGLYTVDIENIGAPELDETFHVTVNDGVQEAIVAYSPLTYCQSIRGKDSSSDALKDVCAALYLYNQAANSYFVDPE